MESRTRRTVADYTVAFKLAVVDQIERGEMTYKAAQKLYGIQGASTVLGWLRRYGRQDWTGPASSRRGEPDMSTRRPPTPEQRIKQLETQLKEATLKARLFEAMLDIIKNDYGVPLPKKPLGKPSGKKLFED